MGKRVIIPLTSMACDQTKRRNVRTGHAGQTEIQSVHSAVNVRRVVRSLSLVHI